MVLNLSLLSKPYLPILPLKAQLSAVSSSVAEEASSLNVAECVPVLGWKLLVLSNQNRALLEAALVAIDSQRWNLMAAPLSASLRALGDYLDSIAPPFCAAVLLIVAGH